MTTVEAESWELAALIDETTLTDFRARPNVWVMSGERKQERSQKEEAINVLLNW